LGIVVNLSPHAVGELVARDSQGQPIYVVVIKATFSFAAADRLEAIAPQPIVDVDQYAGDPATSGVLVAGDLSLPKPRVDVLVRGALKFPAPVTEALVSLEVGDRVRKRLRVHGKRAWAPGVGSSPVPTRPIPVAEVPIAWELSAGGGDVADPKRLDRRNPAGRGPGRAPQDAHGELLPHFEDLADGKTAWNGPHTPCGLGPVAPHWEPRASLAGTYDDRWREQRSPLLPEDFKAEFLNQAPADQQLPSYVPGEEVRLVGMTKGGSARFRLPDLAPPVTFVLRTLIRETRPRVDTIVIEPAEERVSIVARAFCSPRPTASAVREIFVGPLTRGRRLALELGKTFLDLRALPSGRA
jgi:hypothetical protein